MEEKLIGLLVTLVIIALVVGYIISAVGAAIEATLEFLGALWQSGYLAVQELLAWIGSWPGRIEWPAIEPPKIGWPTFPAVTGTPPARPGTPVVGGTLVPGGQAVVANTGGDRLNCRAEAAVDSGVVTKLNEGATVTLIQSQHNSDDGYTWWQVSTKSVTCWVAANWLLPTAAPVVTPTVGPVASPTATPTATTATKGVVMRGNVFDGLSHPLADVRVNLWDTSDETSEYLIAHRYTDRSGGFVFDELSAERDYRIAVVLIDSEDTTPVFFGNNSKKPVEVSTAALSPGPDPVTVDFSDKTLTADDSYKNNLVDLAAFYYRMQEFKRVARDNLDFDSYVSLKSVRAFYQPRCGGGTLAVYSREHQTLTVQATASAHDWSQSPLNREWHEGSHHLMNLVMPKAMSTTMSYYTKGASVEGSNCPEDGSVTPSPTPATPIPTPTPTPIKLTYKNHGGYKNWNSGDSWAEGWAEFWACATKSELAGSDETCIYTTKFDVNLESNWKIWDVKLRKDCFMNFLGFWPGCDPENAPQMEEYAVASLLWDLYDPKDTRRVIGDDDNVDLSAAALWNVFASTQDGTFVNMHQVYGILHAWANFDRLINEDGTLVTTDDIKQIFKNHGFCADKNENKNCDGGETIGYAGWRAGKPRE